VTGSIHEHMAEKAELAAIYAQDGAFRRAAEILRKLADTLAEHAVSTDAVLEELSSGSSKS
jgi:hypothetical protein